jgi:folate-binding protein YgfZ
MSSPSMSAPTQSPPPGLHALLHTAAFASLESTGWVRVTGEDRVRWLNGMVTNSIVSLAYGEGSYSFALSAQGRIQGDLIAWKLEDSILLETSRPAELAAWFERYIIMDDVELTVLSRQQASEEDSTAPQRHGLLLAGPHAASTFASILGSSEMSAPLHFAEQPWRSGTLQIFQVPGPLVPRFELWTDDANLVDQVKSALLVQGVLHAEASDLESLRLLEGTPRLGTDIREKELPQETAQTRALHFNKGCYLGQEIVERIHSRGAVHRTFSGFLLTGEVPAAGTRLATSEDPGKPVGELTSAAQINLPSGPITVGLGYVRREFLDRRAALVYPGGTALPVSLPFTSALPVETCADQTASQVAAAT